MVSWCLLGNPQHCFNFINPGRLRKAILQKKVSRALESYSCAAASVIFLQKWSTMWIDTLLNGCFHEKLRKDMIYMVYNGRTWKNIVKDWWTFMNIDRNQQIPGFQGTHGYPVLKQSHDAGPFSPSATFFSQQSHQIRCLLSLSAKLATSHRSHTTQVMVGVIIPNIWRKKKMFQTTNQLFCGFFTRVLFPPQLRDFLASIMVIYSFFCRVWPSLRAIGPSLHGLGRYMFGAMVCSSSKVCSCVQVWPRLIDDGDSVKMCKDTTIYRNKVLWFMQISWIFLYRSPSLYLVNDGPPMLDPPAAHLQLKAGKPLTGFSNLAQKWQQTNISHSPFSKFNHVWGSMKTKVLAIVVLLLAKNHHNRCVAIMLRSSSWIHKTAWSKTVQSFPDTASSKVWKRTIPLRNVQHH